MVKLDSDTQDKLEELQRETLGSTSKKDVIGKAVDELYEKVIGQNGTMELYDDESGVGKLIAESKE